MPDDKIVEQLEKLNQQIRRVRFDTFIVVFVIGVFVGIMIAVAIL